MSKTFNLKEIQDIVLNIIKDNDWVIHKSHFKYANASGYEYRIDTQPVDKNELDKREQQISAEEFAYNIDFFSDNKNPLEEQNLRCTNEQTFYILSQILEKTNINTVKSLDFLVDRERLKNWEKVLSYIDYKKDQDTPKALSLFLKNYYCSLSTRDIQAVFSSIKEVDLSPIERHEGINNFCANHLDDILKNTAYKTFIINKVKDLIPEKKEYYKNFLQMTNSDKNVFSDTDEQYKTYHMSKDVIMKNYELNLDQPTSTEDYFAILDSAVGFLNKKVTLKKINCEDLLLTGKQKKYDNFVLTIKMKNNFDFTVIQDFLLKVLEESVTLTNSKTLDTPKVKFSRYSTSKLRETLSNSYDKILNFTVLDRKIPQKEEKIKLNKI